MPREQTVAGVLHVHFRVHVHEFPYAPLAISKGRFIISPLCESALRDQLLGRPGAPDSGKSPA